MSQHERSGWRDEELSRRHREWGYNCPCVDLDFVVVEYNTGKAVALIEYKHHNAKMQDTKHPTYRALSDLADSYSGGALPFFIARYWPGCWAFSIWPVNEASRAIVGHPRAWLTERQYVTFIYKLRAMKLAEEIERGSVSVELNDTLPPEVTREESIENWHACN